MLDYTGTPLATLGPDHVFWNSNFTQNPVPEGCYRLCAESIEGFLPAPSSLSPVLYDVVISLSNSQEKRITGRHEAEFRNLSSTLCIPSGATLPSEFNRGWFIGDFGYPNIVMDFESDPLNCGGCNIKCPAGKICRNKACVANGDFRITLISWNRTGDLDLLVFPPVNGTAVSFDDPGPRSTSAWGRLEADSELNGPENVFWDQSRPIDGTLYPTPQGEYRIVSIIL